MTEDDRAVPGPAGSTTITEVRGSAWRRWSVLLPALALVAGLLLGGAVVGAATRSSGSDGAVAAGPSPTAVTPSAGSTPLTVRVPGPCVQAADGADEAYGLLEQAATAARNLDAGALADVVAQVQQRRPEVESLVRQCREQAGSALVEPSPTPVPTG